jgi:hypothetical protein
MLAGVAHAQVPPPPPPLPGGPEPATTEPIPSRWMGLGLVLIPSGSLKYDAGGQSDSTGIASAYGIELTATRTFASGIQLVVAPRFLSGIKASEDAGDEAANQLDLRFGLGYSLPLSPGLYGNGVVGTGWSMIFPPDEIDGESYTPMGPVLGFGAGVTYILGPKLAINAGLGYQIGFHKVTIRGVTGTLSDDLFDLTVRLMFATGS